MRFALVNNERVEAEPKLQGLCPGCLQPVIAKCGTRRIRHWAHRTERTCDSWWEPETEWHRTWKGNFPPECQEIIQHDQTGEKHIADVRTNHGLVIEFQHSHLDLQERIARERFYRNMVWVVDGTRLKRDYTRFLKNKDYLRPTIQRGYFLVARPEECFPVNWLESSVPVIFDFKGVTPADPPDAMREILWCLLPRRAEGNAVVVGMSRKDFVKIAPSRPILLDVRKIIRDFTWYIQHQRKVAEIDYRRRYYRQAMPRQRRRRNRRF